MKTLAVIVFLILLFVFRLVFKTRSASRAVSNTVKDAWNLAKTEQTLSDDFKQTVLDDFKVVSNHVLSNSLISARGLTEIIVHNSLVKDIRPGSIVQRMREQGNFNEEELPLVIAYISGVYDGLIKTILGDQTQKSHIPDRNEYLTLARQISSTKPSLGLSIAKSEHGGEYKDTDEIFTDLLMKFRQGETYNLGRKIATEHMHEISKVTGDTSNVTSPNLGDLNQVLQKV